MTSKKIIEDQIYIRVIESFNEPKEIDHEIIEKLIADACSAVEAEGEGMKIDVDVVVRNVLLLILASLHKDTPIDNLGQDLHDLPPSKLAKFLEDIHGMI
ncbi:MAG TPA: hypothetical protein VKM55_24770 [Candidatus Lokiarchaeia archaeon]|nr:hypothetical protein [Candidatus Lokiarchaeia archaeon]